MISILVILVLSYLVGSIPGSVWMGKLLHGIDVREHGSGNAGATNTFRVLGWKAGVLASLVDLGKGLLAAGVIASLRLDALPAASFWDMDTVVRLMAGVAAVLGHMFPIWARFQGGKGALTSAGVLFAVTPVITAIVCTIFIVVLLTTRYVSLASLLGTAAYPTLIAVRKYLFGVESLDISVLIFGLVLATGIFVMHRGNIQRLLNGTERRIGSFKPSRGMQGEPEG